MATNHYHSFKNNGTKTRIPQSRNKKWDPPSQKNKNTNNKLSEEESSTTQDNIQNLRKEIERLEEINNKYENDYQHQRKILLFNLYKSNISWTQKQRTGQLNTN